MKIIANKEGIQRALFDHRCLNKSIGLVPTMGALHEGHLSLVQQSKLNSYITIVSIFVNPTQFNNPLDLEKYPRTPDKDLALLEKAGVDYVFMPEVQVIYPEPTTLAFDFGLLETSLEGEFRPGHFNGVGIVVSKLFHILHPSHVYFGQKDLQQVAVIRRLVHDLSFDLKIIVVPTKREKDGLAMSSRNILLDGEERKLASILYKRLSLAKDELLKGESWLEVKTQNKRAFEGNPQVGLEYFELVKSDSMEIVSGIGAESSYSICTACYIGKTRLIDNITVA